MKMLGSQSLRGFRRIPVCKLCSTPSDVCTGYFQTQTAAGFLPDLLYPYDEPSAVYGDIGVATAPDPVVEYKALAGLGG